MRIRKLVGDILRRELQMPDGMRFDDGSRATAAALPELQQDPCHPAGGLALEYLDSVRIARHIARQTERKPVQKSLLAVRTSGTDVDRMVDQDFECVVLAIGKRDEAAERFDLALKGDGADVDRGAIEKRLQQLGRKAR